jgi:hypothetical protein
MRAMVGNDEPRMSSARNGKDHARKGGEHLRTVTPSWAHTHIHTCTHLYVPYSRAPQQWGASPPGRFGMHVSREANRLREHAVLWHSAAPVQFDGRLCTASNTNTVTTRGRHSQRHFPLRAVGHAKFSFGSRSTEQQTAFAGMLCFDNVRCASPTQHHVQDIPWHGMRIVLAGSAPSIMS